MSDVMNALKKLNIEVIDKIYGDNALLTIAVPQDIVTETWLKFKALILKKDLDEANTVPHIGGLKWEEGD
jgi:hypothetical protein